MGFRKLSASRIEELHNRVVDAIGKGRRKYTMQEVIAALELVKSEVIYQHLLNEYSIKIDAVSEPPSSITFDEKGRPMMLVE